MHRPLIGLTCHAWPGEILRSAVGQRYVDAIAVCGAAPISIPIGLERSAQRRIFEVLDGLFLPGGDDVGPERYGHTPHAMLGNVDPLRDELEITMAQWALQEDLPLLGICRGAQVVAVAAGGTLYQDIDDQLPAGLPHDVREHGREHLSHSVAVEPGSRLCAAIGCTTSTVNSLHHQAVRDVPAGFVVSARSEDGIIEAIEAPSKQFAVGVQCHPEWIWASSAPEYHGLFAAFVDAAAFRAATRAA
jgi:putative glutamine amidotransferase